MSLIATREHARGCGYSCKPDTCLCWCHEKRDSTPQPAQPSKSWGFSGHIESFPDTPPAPNRPKESQPTSEPSLHPETCKCEGTGWYRPRAMGPKFRCTENPFSSQSVQPSAGSGDAEKWLRETRDWDKSGRGYIRKSDGRLESLGDTLAAFARSRDERLREQFAALERWNPCEHDFGCMAKVENGDWLFRSDVERLLRGK